MAIFGCIVAQGLAHFLYKSRALWTMHTVVAAQLCSSKTSFTEGLDLANPCCDHRLRLLGLEGNLSSDLVLKIICGILTKFLSGILENMGMGDTFMIK